MRGEELSPDDTVRRQDAVSLVSSVVNAGSRIYNEDRVQLTKDGRHFVVEVPSVERDRTGRLAPIICYGDFVAMAEDDLSDSVALGLDRFAKRIGRNVLPEHLRLARESLSTLKKKSSRKKLARFLVVGLLALILLVLVLWQISTRAQEISTQGDRLGRRQF